MKDFKPIIVITYKCNKSLPEIVNQMIHNSGFTINNNYSNNKIINSKKMMNNNN